MEGREGRGQAEARIKLNRIVLLAMDQRGKQRGRARFTLLGDYRILRRSCTLHAHATIIDTVISTCGTMIMPIDNEIVRRARFD